MSWVGFRYARGAWASDETFHCDRRRDTLCSDCIGKGEIVLGTSLQNTRPQVVLPGLKAPEAKSILAGLKALGADVPDDHSLKKRINETLETCGDTSWMDRS